MSIAIHGADLSAATSYLSRSRCPRHPPSLRPAGRARCEPAADVGAQLVADPFDFTLTLDESKPTPTDYLTRRVAKLKLPLGVDQKRPATVALEDSQGDATTLVAPNRLRLLSSN